MLSVFSSFPHGSFSASVSLPEGRRRRRGLRAQDSVNSLVPGAPAAAARLPPQGGGRPLLLCLQRPHPGVGGGEQGPVGTWPCVTASLQTWNCLPRSSNLPPPHFPWPVHSAVTGSARFRAISSCHCGDSPAPEGLLLPSCCGASGDEMASLHGAHNPPASSWGGHLRQLTCAPFSAWTVGVST